MAEENLSSTSEWRKVRRSHKSARFCPVIKIRRNGVLAISADFVRMAAIADCSRATLFLSSDGRRLAISFHSDERDDDAFVLCHDGGGSKRTPDRLNRIITARSLLSQSPVISALVRESPATRKYEPKKGIDGRWIISLVPCFEMVLVEPGEIVPGATGIYRYRLGAETVYIGRGDIRQRAASPDRRAWEFDKIEYSILNDDVAERKWESYWLDEYRRQHNRWPIHNRIAGVAAKATEHG